MSQVPQPIQWDQGMLLTPKHFLELAGRYEMLQQDLAVKPHPQSWGVIRFDYDRDKLASGTVEITELLAIMPDGTLVAVAPKDAEPLRLDISGKDNTEVFLGIPRKREFKWKGENARYEGSQAVSGDGSIPRLRPILRLFDKEPPASWISIRLLKVALDIRYGNDFEPPRIIVGSSGLKRTAAKIVELLRGRIRILIRQIARSNQFQGDLAGFRHFLSLESRLRSLVAGLPVLEATLQASEQCHPFTLYLALCSVAGEVAPMAGNPEPPDFGTKYPYDHSDPLRCFKGVSQYIRESVEYGVPQDWDRFTFEFKEGGFRLAAQPELATYPGDDEHWPSFVIALLPSAQALAAPSSTVEQSQGATIEWGRNCVIASAGEDIKKHLRDRTLGARRELLENPPDLPTPPEWVLFGISKDSKLNLSLPLQLEGTKGAHPPQRADFYVRRPRDRQDLKV
jgi:type VI secretion system protein ImpJ